MCHRILCYGDSNTYGYDPRSYLGDRYPKPIRWTGLLEAAGWTVINEGVNGRSIPQVDRELETAVQVIRRAEAKVLVIMLGSNDLLQRPSISAGVCSGRMELFLRKLIPEAIFPHQILLVAPPPMKPGAWVGDPGILDESRQLADCYNTLAQKLGIRFADAGEWNVELAFDGVHFSEAGHRAFAEGIQRPIMELLGS